jgi:uncharacterized membrane protein YbhN (UPF0104 family)
VTTPPAVTMPRHGLKTALQLLALGVALVFAVRALSGQWSELRAVAADVRLDWAWIAVGSVVVLLTHASLVQGWRMLLAGWDRAPAFWPSVRIWSISNLGRYIPGKIWSVGALSILAERAGVSGVAAASAAILGTLLNLGAGFGIVALSGARVLGTIEPWMQGAAIAGAAAFIVGVLLLPRLLPPIVRSITSRRGLPPVDRHLSPTRLWSVTAINALSWVGYGVAFDAFSRGVTPQVAGAGAAFITVYTASYLWGYLVLFAPGGIGFREVALVAMLVALGMGTQPEATVLALASRVWITVLEILPGLIALLLNPGASRLLTRSAK